MADITLVKIHDFTLSDVERAALYKLLFGGYLKGATDEDEKMWKRCWKRLAGMGEGELAKFSFKTIRNGKFHRKFFAMLTVGFDAWEPGRKHKTYKGQSVAKNFEKFREEVTILAGFYEQSFDLDGNLQLIAKSISFANMTQEEFEAVYDAVANVILSKVLTSYKGRDELNDVVDRVLRFL